MSNQRPYIWQMVKQAIESLGGKATNREIRAFIHQTYDNVKDSTIGAQINVCTVNSPSRIHYPENSRPRKAESQYDFLFSVGRGTVERYDPEKHGLWEIRETDLGKLAVVRSDDDSAPNLSEEAVSQDEEVHTTLLFPLESHLRDFLARNLSSLDIDNRHLNLYVNDLQQDGVEYRTDVGPIDILAIDEDANFYVFELKLARGNDAALGQLLRYMGWVKRELAGDRSVIGVVVASRVDNKLLYAASMLPNIRLFEYKVDFTISSVSLPSQ